ncbi:hypothetical protein VP01_1338g4 [Puccinia sorghi]|uniref:Uncharacterized protein n=1 Tax=Puccinia sorghi TaxID=27349 RepID=A0A0L6VMD1_9BASI|nr:hypothetical protein VP01_1338g4 [Puccinia sorghi]
MWNIPSDLLGGSIESIELYFPVVFSLEPYILRNSSCLSGRNVNDQVTIFASEFWLARFCSVMSDFERSKLTIDQFGGLSPQAIVKAPPGTHAKKFEYSISQPLDDMLNPPLFGKVTTIIQSALSNAPRAWQQHSHQAQSHPMWKYPSMQLIVATTIAMNHHHAKFDVKTCQVT